MCLSDPHKSRAMVPRFPAGGQDAVPEQVDKWTAVYLIAFIGNY